MPIENMEEEGLAKAGSPRKSFIFRYGYYIKRFFSDLIASLIILAIWKSWKKKLFFVNSEFVKNIFWGGFLFLFLQDPADMHSEFHL